MNTPIELLEQAQAQVTDLTAQLNQAHGEIKAANELLENAQAQIADLQAKGDSALAELNEKINALNIEAESRQAELLNAKAENETLQAELAGAKMKLAHPAFAHAEGGRKPVSDAEGAQDGEDILATYNALPASKKQAFYNQNRAFFLTQRG
jgi:chromosome segregation ATPase